MESSQTTVENSEVSIPFSFFMLSENKLKILSTKLRIKWMESNVKLGIEPKDDIEDADDLFKFVLEKVDSQKVPHWHIMKTVTDFYTSVHILDQGSFYLKYYEQMNLLGKGGFGVVFKCKHRFDGTEYAVKLISFSDKCKEDTFNTLDDELAAGRDFSKSEILHIFKDALEGLHYIHSKNLIHGDISTTNIFFDFNGMVKLGDFGLVIENDMLQGVIMGKVKYHAPELKKRQPGQIVTRGIWTQSCDVYALAVVMLELVFSITTDMELYKLFECWNNEGRFPDQKQSWVMLKCRFWNQC